MSDNSRVRGKLIGVKMAASGILPTYQRYINGVPVSSNRRSPLKLREKYIVLLVFITFGIVCFGAFFYLPDLREKVPRNIFIPERDGLQLIRHPEDHRVKERDILFDRAAREDAIRKSLNIGKEEHEKIKGNIQQSKNETKQKLKEEEMKKKEEEMKENLKEVKDHQGWKKDVKNTEEDKDIQDKRETIKRVGDRCLSCKKLSSRTLKP